MGRTRAYAERAVPLKRELRDQIPKEPLKALHRKQAWRHALISLRHMGLCLASFWALVHIIHPLLWIPLAVFQGFILFGFTVLLHDTIHGAVFSTPRPRATALLRLLYGLPSGLNPSQFERWHLDHHDGLGSATEDPKRHHLSPKKNARWLKVLYATPALFPIYFRAAGREAQSYPESLRRKIRTERTLVMVLHLMVVFAAGALGGPGAVLRAYVIPYFVGFPLAFTINRVGQHYDIVAEDPRRWTTLVRGNFLWDFLFLSSDYHLEHHYFAGVPLYNLARLQKLLWPYYMKVGFRPRTYGGILWDWFVRNKEPHTNWARS